MRKLIIDYWIGLGGGFVIRKGYVNRLGFRYFIRWIKVLNWWFDRFKSRNGIKVKFIFGEVGDVCEEIVDFWKERFLEFL